MYVLFLFLDEKTEAWGWEAAEPICAVRAICTWTWLLWSQVSFHLAGRTACSLLTGSLGAEAFSTLWVWEEQVHNELATRECGGPLAFSGIFWPETFWGPGRGNSEHRQCLPCFCPRRGKWGSSWEGWWVRCNKVGVGVGTREMLFSVP